MAEQPKIQDDITIQLQVQKNIVHENVRINVSIQAQVDPEQSEASFRKEIQRTLRDFIPGDWKIQNISRQKGNQFETVFVNATVRVSDKEDYKLESRAARVSRIGFELINPRAEYTLTFDEIQGVNKELRLTLMKQALVECKEYNDACKDAKFSAKYRVSSSRFDNGVSTSLNNMKAMSANVMMAASPMISSGPYHTEGCDDEGTADIGVNSRFSMTGTFVLRSVHD